MREMLDSQNASEALAERVEGDRMAAFGMSETGADSAVLLKTQRLGRVLTVKVQTAGWRAWVGLKREPPQDSPLLYGNGLNPNSFKKELCFSFAARMDASMATNSS
jgi:hypothetical protein